MKAKLPNIKYLGCDLYIDKEEEYEGQAVEYAEIVSLALGNLHHELANSVPREFIYGSRNESLKL